MKGIGLTFLSLASALYILVPQKAIANKDMRGSVKVDGSSTVLPITEAIAEEFGKVFPRIRVTIGKSGTGGGFEKFSKGETDINNASRTIKSGEADRMKTAGIGYIGLAVAHDGISVVVNPQNTWVDHLTVAELKKIWQPGSKVTQWSDIRPNWPKEPIRLYGPGTDSGTFDYFTEAVNGKSHVSRGDFNKSEDDNALVTGVAGDKYALGYFGFAYYVENAKKLKVVPIDNGKGPVTPSFETIKNGSYAPLGREVYIYVADKASQRPEVAEFVRFYLNNASDIVKDVGYVPLSKDKYQAGLGTFDKFVSGSKK